MSEHQSTGLGKTPDSAEETTARLLRLAGMRATVPPDAEQRVRHAVLDEIRSVARARRVNRRLVAAGVLLGAAAAVILAARVRPFFLSDTPPAAAAVATAERVDGAGVTRRARVSGDRVAVGPGSVLAVGDEIETGHSGRLAFRLAAGASVRIDRESRARLVSAMALDLVQGALYIDSGAGSSANLEVNTPFGLVKDVGTQFETRLERGGLVVRVRSGLVEVHRRAEIASARPGSELRIGPAGTTTRAIPTFGPEWAWVTALVAPFDVDGQPLGAFLEYLCREQGWTLAYADPRLARDVSGIVVHGSVEGLSPVDALSVVLSTSGLTSRLEDGHLVVSRAGGS